MLVDDKYKKEDQEAIQMISKNFIKGTDVQTSKSVKVKWNLENIYGVQTVSVLIVEPKRRRTNERSGSGKKRRTGSEKGAPGGQGEPGPSVQPAAGDIASA